MSETVVRKRRGRGAGGETPQEYAADCDAVTQQLRVESYRRDLLRRPWVYDGWDPPNLPAGWREPVDENDTGSCVV